MMRTLIVLMVFGLLPVSAAATDLILGAEFAGEWDDNVLSRPEDTTSDFTFRYGPRIELDEPDGRFRWRARYSPDYQDFVELDDLDGWDHDARLDVDWDITKRTSVSFSEQYLDLAQFTRLVGTDPISSPDVPLVSFDRQGIKRNRAVLSIDHLLTYRQVLRFDVSNTNSDFEGERADTNFWAANLNYTFRYSPRTTIGWILSAQQQQIDREDFDTIKTNYYNLSLQWIHEFDPTLSLSVAAGPALVDRDATEQVVISVNELAYPLQRSAAGFGPVAVSTCPTLSDGTPVLAPACDEISLFAFPDRSFLAEMTDVMLVGGFPESSTSSITYFANVSLRKEWSRNLSTSLQYRRSAVTSAGQGGQVSDVVLGVVSWRPLQRLRLTFTASWENREQATDGVNFVRTLTAETIQGVPDVGRQAGIRAIAVTREIRNVRYTATFSARYQLTEQTSLFSRMYWYQQEIKDTAIRTSKTTRFRIVLGVTYYFEPIGLPI